MEKELFKKFYDELYREILDGYYQYIDKRTKNNKISSLITFIIIAPLPTVLFWSYFFQKEYIFLFIVTTIIYNISIFILLRLFYIDTDKDILKSIKYQILDDLIVLITNDEKAKILPNNRISKDSFIKTDLFNFDELKYNGSNFIQTKINNKSIVIADIDIYTLIDKYKEEYIYVGKKKILRTYKTKQKKDYLKGCYIGSDINKKNEVLIQIIPKNINKKNNYYNLCNNKLYLENNEFYDKYDIYSNDEINARKILTLSMMENINKIDNILQNKKHIVFKPDGRYAIFITDITIEKILDKNIKTKRNKNKEFEELYNAYEEIYKLFIIADIINNSR